EYGFVTIETHARGDAVVEVDGRLRRVSGRTPPLSWVGKQDAAQLGWRIGRAASKISTSEPWLHPRAERLDHVSFAEWLKNNAFSEEARSYWHYIVESGMCASPDDFSPFEVSQQVATLGGLGQLETADQEFFEEGAQTIAERMAEELGDRLHLLTPVHEIRHDGRLVEAITDQDVFYGHRVILALPPQLIGQISFGDDIACRRQTRRKDLVLGRVVKNVVVYDHAWWRDAGLSGTAETPNVPVNFLVDTSNSVGQPGILVALATGPHAAILGRMDHETRRAAVLSHVRRVLGDPPARSGAFFSMDWTSERWSLGGYASRRTIGGWTDQEHILSPPCGPVHFAGTETATEWRSYMEGALQSAERSSMEVINALKQQ
ncbi:MAG: FAD-dependent oxidoreductase, partial [Rubrobacteraceae bacterium]